MEAKEILPFLGFLGTDLMVSFAMLTLNHLCKKLLSWHSSSALRLKLSVMCFPSQTGLWNGILHFRHVHQCVSEHGCRLPLLLSFVECVLSV